MNKKLYEEEGRNLARLFKEHGIKNKSQFARDNKIGPNGNIISQHIKGIRPISMAIGRAYAAGLKIPLAEVSKRLADEAEKQARALGITSDENTAPIKYDFKWPFSISHEQYMEIDEEKRKTLDAQIAVVNAGIKKAYEEHQRKKKKPTERQGKTGTG